MKACGIIAEWNPFHNGHAYLLAEARKKTEAEVLIIAMSGNYTQRGEPAIISKWERAKTGLLNGADIVIELPFWFATQPADIFAQGGVALLNAMACTDIAFGVDTDDFADYERLAHWLVAHPHQVQAAAQLMQSSQASFAEKQISIIRYLQKNYTELGKLNISFDKSSNTLLGFTYAKAIAQMDLNMKITTVKRQGARHNEGLGPSQHRFASGSAIRQQLIAEPDLAKTREILQNVMPGSLLETLMSKKHLPSMEKLYPFIRYLLLCQTAEQLGYIYQIHEGIERRLIKLALEKRDYLSFISAAKHRSWPEPRIRRALLMIGLQIDEQDIRKLKKGVQPLHLLGASTKGRQYLKNLAADPIHQWQLISRVNHETAKKWPMWLKVDKIYQEYLTESSQDENFGQPPLFMEGNL